MDVFYTYLDTIFNYIIRYFPCAIFGSYIYLIDSASPSPRRPQPGLLGGLARAAPLRGA